MNLSSLYKTLTSDTTEAYLHFPPANTPVEYHASSPDNWKCVPITNARMQEQAPSLTNEGFCLIQNKELLPRLDAKANTDQLVERFQIELQTHVSFNRCFHLGTTVRASSQQIIPSAIQSNVPRPVADLVHADWGCERFQTFLDTKIDTIVNNEKIRVSEVKSSLASAKSWSIYNIWLPLSVIVSPALALCARNTISYDDYVNINFKAVKSGDKTINSQLLTLKPNENHQWFYYPLMQCNEFLIFHQLSHDMRVSKPVFHSAFELVPPMTLGSYVRRSIEFRFLVVH